ncbi:sensor histidine kinase [Crassaminicella indica]|uniref:histidine kinase n=2 Tax=Crassaminicella indica TaxID=2855394 RepID=A0ABX8RED0_9CLOT|nr:sensor histidine kinase [Crassaminicella indica]
MILIFAVVSVGSYAPVKEIVFNTEGNTKAYIQSNNFIYTLANLTRYLKKSKLEGKDWYNYRYEELKSIKYYISNKDKAISISNMSDVTENEVQEQINKSQFYMHVKIDENGNPKIESSLGEKFNKSAFIDGLNLRHVKKMEYANLDILYIVPKNLDNYNDIFIYNIKDFSIMSYCILILAIGALSIIILSIIAFSIPYDIQREIPICRFFNKMFLEFKGLFWLGFICCVCIGGIYYFDNSLEGWSKFIDIIYSTNVYFYLILIPITFVLYLLIYLSIVYIKYIYHTGFKKGFIENSILGKICIYIFRKIKKTFQEIIKIDVTKDIHKKLIIILGINLIALWIIALFGPFGIVLGGIYTLFLFKYLLKLILKVKALNDASKKLSEGDFNIAFEENMGIFSPICENLNNIKDGFKVAIDKEIKSQQMKTELISNVSHDLKTPLTSIITYIDLLKKEEIKDETQKEYINILDRKSKRLKALIEDLFEASKASSGNIDLNLEKLDVVALFRQTLGEMEEKINQSTLQMKMKLPENKVICELDGRRTYRVFENIMSNILKYAMPHSRVYIDALEDEKEISFIFKNISAYEMNFDADEITERFTRGDKSRNTEGSGLGLAIAKSLMELQNGNLSITIDGDLFKLIVTFQKSENI